MRGRGRLDPISKPGRLTWLQSKPPRKPAETQGEPSGFLKAPIMANHNIPSLPGISALDADDLRQLKASHHGEPRDAKKISARIKRLTAEIRGRWSEHERLRRAGARGAPEAMTVPVIFDRELCEQIEQGAE